MVEIQRQLDHEQLGSSWSALKDLGQLVGADEAQGLYGKLAELVSEHAENSEKMPEGEPDAELHQAPNELYILALSAALQRASDAQPSYVEYRLRQVLRRLGMCLEACQSYFIQPRPSVSHLYDGEHGAS